MIFYFITLHFWNKIIEMEKRWVITWSQGWEYEREVSVAIKGQHKGSLCRWDILYLDCINVNILLMAWAWQTGKANLYLDKYLFQGSQIAKSNFTSPWNRYIMQSTYIRQLCSQPTSDNWLVLLGQGYCTVGSIVDSTVDRLDILCTCYSS